MITPLQFKHEVFDETYYCKSDKMSLIEYEFSSDQTLIKSCYSVLNHLLGFKPDIHWTADNSCTDKKSIWIALSPLYSRVCSEQDRLCVVFGELLHEIGHIKFTDFEIFRKAGSFEREILNIFEDRHIENAIIKELPSARNALTLTRKFYSAIQYPSLNDVFAKEGARGIIKSYLIYKVLYSASFKSEEFESKAKAHFPLLSPAQEKKLNRILTTIPVSTADSASRAKWIVQNLFKMTPYYTSFSLSDLKQSIESLDEPTDSEEHMTQEEILELLEEVGDEKNAEDAMDSKQYTPSDTIKESQDLSRIPVEPRNINTRIEAFKQIEKELEESMTVNTNSEFLKNVTNTIVWEEKNRKRTVLNDYELLKKGLFQFYEGKERALRQADVFELEEGDIDEDALATSQVDRNIFWDTNQKPQRAGLEVSLLIDNSGSMSGPNHKKAKGIAKGLVDFFSLNKNNSVKAFAFTTEGQMTRVRVLTGRTTEETKQMIEGLSAESENHDLNALKAVASKFSKSSHKKLLVIISDGQPAASGFAGDAAMRAVRQFVSELESKRIIVLSIGVDHISHHELMYRHCVPYNPGRLAQDVTRKVKQLMS